jgi:dolichol-phosphate mannosyltransferase
MSEGVLIIIPTYDEKDNVGPISEAVFKAQPDAEILFVDDNSPDGTGRVIDELAARNPKVHALHREKKNGLGRAYIAGFKWALARKYEFIFEMDADFSHDPNEIPRFLKKAENADLVLGSRYLHGVRITNWPIRRLALSKGAASYVRIITGMPVTDPTGGFKCYRRRVLEAINLDVIESSGYSFQVEMSHTTWMRGFRIAETPITFVDRRAGYSKMSSAIFEEAITMVWKLAFRNGFKRSPNPVASTRPQPEPVDEDPCTYNPCGIFCDIFQALRPTQWTKNLVLLAAFLFAYWDLSREGMADTVLLSRIIPALILFCFLSSGVYLINDVADYEADRRHPVKKHRPIASNRVGRGLAVLLSLGLLVLALLGSAAMSHTFGLIALAYVMIQFVYTFFLKKVPFVDVLVIATGFVLRAVAGTQALGEVRVSIWLLLCTFLLALFLALCKRRHEKISIKEQDTEQRPSLAGYDTATLDKLIFAAATATLLCYTVYTMWPDTVNKFGTWWLTATIPFVVYGLARYLYLVYHCEQGDRPEKILLSDFPLITDILLYGLTVLLIMRLTS